MNKKNINFQFLKVILENDLVFSNLKKGFFSILKKRLSNVSVFNLFYLSKSLKQLIRVIYFMGGLKKNLIYILLKNKLCINLFSDLLNTNKNNLFLSSNFPKENILFKSNTFIFFNENNNKLSYKSVVSLFDKNFLLLNIISSFLLKNDNSSSYKVQSGLDDFKKISFFFILIRQCIKKNA
jgi:hypothetical protein